MQLSKKAILILMIVSGVVLLGLFFFSFRSNGQKKPEDEGVTQTLSDGIAQEMSDSKSDAYRGRISTDDYFDQLGAKMADVDVISLMSSEDQDSSAGHSSSTREDNDEAAVARTFGAPTADSPAQSRHSVCSNAPRQMSEQERLEYERRRAEMVRDVLNGGDETLRQAQGDRGTARGDCHSELSEEPFRAIELPAGDASDGIVSSLDDDFEDSAVQYEGAKRPFRCMFVRDEKLRSGQRVTLRLLEDYADGGVRIPANTHLAAVCKIGDRLELQVRSLEMNGRIVPLTLDAFDTDGLQGIYCPETTAARGARHASQEAISTAGTTFGGLVGDIASTVIRTGASIARSASGEVSVSVVSGYEFYLVKSERR